MRTQLLSDPAFLATGTWLAAGVVVFGLTPLPLHSAAWGWTPAFWALAAPALMLFARYVSAFTAAPLAPTARLSCTYPRATARRGHRANRKRKAQSTTPLRLASMRRSSSRMIAR